MKNRQFITLLLVVVIGFIYLGSRIETMQRYISTIDKNVATVDERIVWDVAPKIRDVEEYSLQALEIITDKLY